MKRHTLNPKPQGGSTVSQRQIDRCRIDYTGSAKSYDQERLRDRKNEYLESLRRSVVLKLVGEMDRDCQILDVGSGTGRGLQYLGGAGYGNLTALDYTAPMLQLAREKLAGIPQLTTVRFIQGDAFNLPFASSTFDLVITLNFLHLFRLDLQAHLINEMCRVCRPGGLVVAEFENVHKALFVSRYVEQFLHRRTTKLNSAREIRRLFGHDSFSEVRVLGTDLPLAHRALKYLPRIGTMVERISHLPILKWTAGRIIVAGRRSRRTAG